VTLSFEMAMSAVTLVVQFIGFAVLFGKYAQCVDTDGGRIERVEDAVERMADAQATAGREMSAFAERMSGVLDRIEALEAETRRGG